MSEEQTKRLTVKQQLFIDYYLMHFNATKAAIQAGYSEKTAYSIGSELLKKPEIKALIDARLKDSRMNADQVMKLMTDIAGSNINDYFKVIEIERPKTVKKPLQELIDRKKESLLRQHIFAERKGFIEEDMDKFLESLEPQEDEIMRLEIRLEREPDAIFEDMELEIVQEVRLDLVKLASDKESGKIKSFEMKEFGPKVELYPVDGMLDKLARVNGMYTDTLVVDDKNKIDPNDLSDDAIRELMKLAKKQ
ncbi:terminase small subunit [Sphingobacterium psychroaquaticum]|uniref:Terminase small subunit n=1 Tax=Sphingobacterium psychroaquaticum TaxID=561061 RepID=A0A1X7JUM6_9SPHI|nr:terminase small subunit [Sphingobacterium psychroaquaticum]SMG32020.1 Terminase small subunit [Sphingobacterium psychroaquaticum]